MAEKEAGGLSMRIGIRLSELQSDFLQAEQTVRQGIAALNRQQNIVRLRMETDVAGLDSFADKTKIIEVREQALNQLLEMQRDRLKLATVAFQDYTKSEKAHEAESKRLETAMERERLAVTRLESELKNLSAQKISLDVSGLQSNIEKISARIQNIRLKAEIDVSQLQSANRAFDAQKTYVAALTNELELQRRKLVELQNARQQSEKVNGKDSVQTLNIKSNILQQIQEINRLEAKLKEFSGAGVNLQFRIDSLRNIESTIQEKIAQINARVENIRIKSEIDTSRVSVSATEFDKAKVHVAALNQELELQKQKLNELKTAIFNSTQMYGANNSRTLGLSNEYLKQIQAIDQLKAKIEELNKVQPSKSNLLSNYLNIKGDIAGRLSQISSAFSGVASASQSADGAITKALDVISAIPHPVGKAVAALASIPLVFVGIEHSVVDMLRATASAGDSVYVMSRGFQMSIADTGKFTSMCKTAGVEVNDLASTIRRTQQQIIRGGEHGKAENWLKRYGESAFDASGHLKNMNEMTLTLSRALKRAQAEGNGMAFILGTMRMASADAITAIEDAEGVYKQVAGLVKNGLMDPAFAHEVQGNLNALNLQTSFMTSTFKSALLPVANEIVPRLTERMAKLTQVIADNKDVIKDFGRTAAEAFLKMEKGAEAVLGAVGSVAKFLSDLKKNPREQEIVTKYKYDTDIKTVDDLIKKEQPKAFDIIKENPRLYWQVKAIYEPLFKALNEVQKEIERENKKLSKNLQEPLTSIADISTAGAERRNGLEDRIGVAKEAVKQAKTLSDELYKITHTNYENKKFDVLNWRQELLNSEETTANERNLVEKISVVKLEQIEKEHAAEMAKIRERVQEHYKNAADIQFEITHAAFEKELRDIEQWKDAQLEKVEVAEEVSAIVAEAAAKEARAFEREVDRIKGKTQTLYDKIFEIDHSQYENDLRKIQQEYLQTAQELQESGVLSYYKNDLDYLFGRQQQELAKRAAKDKNYRKSPEGATERGGNGIMVISGDKITDDGLIQSRQKEIGLLADENQILAQLLQKQRQELSGDVMVMLAQKLQSIQQPQITLPPQQQQSGIQIIEGDKVVSMPQIPTQPLQEFSYTLQQLNAQMRQIPATEMPAKQTTPIESLQTLRTSTEGLISAQDILAEKFRSMQIANPTITQGVITSDMSLNNLDVPISTILHEMQAKRETTISTETIVMPLNNIASIAQNILSAMGNANQPDITVSPNIRIDLGGAYVFDNGMKKTLTDDITKEVVDAITTSVNQEIRKSSYSYGA